MIIKRKPKTTLKSIYAQTPARERALDEAIEYIQNCDYKGTAIKIELEAHLGRNGQSHRECRNCGNNGELACSCEGLEKNCKNCKGRGYIICPDCDGEGRIDIHVIQRSDGYCQKFILKSVSRAAREALVFSKTYNDGSVDTEFTFTLMLKDSRYAIEFIKAFKLLAADIGNGIITQNAGMHIAILNDPDGYYARGADENVLEPRRAANFSKSMTSMLPALFFLASPNERSRRLGARSPVISAAKFSAINSGNNCYEYRVFETCYDRPEAILDNICVIANTLKYYSYKQVKHSFFGKIGEVGFDDKAHGLQRFYRTPSAYRALIAGVKVLKPAYKTLSELRRERNFDITLTKIKNKELAKETMYGQEYNIERKDVQEEKEELSQQYKELSKDKAFKIKYPSLTFYMSRMLSNPNILKQGKKAYIDDKKRAELSVSTIIKV